MTGVTKGLHSTFEWRVAAFYTLPEAIWRRPESPMIEYFILRPRSASLSAFFNAMA
jgi:hypothetical protein